MDTVYVYTYNVRYKGVKRPHEAIGCHERSARRTLYLCLKNAE